jgi:uncharacterized protein (TIGR00369 family)
LEAFSPPEGFVNESAQRSLDAMRAYSRTSGFNVLHGIEIERAASGEAELSMPWRPEAGQYQGFLHAGLIGALIDTACGCAAATVVGPVLASHYSVSCLRPAVGQRFVVRARVVKAGRTMVFTSAEVFAQADGKQTLVASGETILNVVAADGP